MKPTRSTPPNEATLRALNQPRTAIVRTDEEGVPDAVALTSPWLDRRKARVLRNDATRRSERRHRNGRSPRSTPTLGTLTPVEWIQESWRIDDEWWRAPISRLYYTLVLEGGTWITIYRDLEDGRWYIQG